MREVRLEISDVFLSKSSQFVDERFLALDHLAILEGHSLASRSPIDLDPFRAAVRTVRTSNSVFQRIESSHIDQTAQLSPIVVRESNLFLHRWILLLRIIRLFDRNQPRRTPGDVHRSTAVAHAFAERCTTGDRHDAFPWTNPIDARPTREQQNTEEHSFRHRRSI